MMWLMLSTLAQAVPASSPVVHADRSIELTLAAPHASTVRVWGDWQPDGAEQPMPRGDNGVWTLKTGPLSPGPHLYAFVVDGLRMADPTNRRVKNGYPGVSSIIDIPNPLLAGLKTGVVHVHTYTGPETSLARTFHVYTPAGFTARSRLPVLFLLHGSSDSDRDWLALGQAAQLLGQAVNAGTAQPMLLVMPDGHPYPSLDVSTRSENLRLLQRELQEIITPTIERHYHPAPGVEKRAAVGASMGGAQVLHLAAQRAWRHPRR
jgi:enterochelin esterase-like enzyme